MYFRITFSAILFLLFTSVEALGQDCSYTISGRVVDHFTQEPLPYVHILMQELSLGVITEEDGSFIIDRICEGDYHIEASHIACESIVLPIYVKKDTTIYIELEHTEYEIGNVTIKAEQGREHSHASDRIKNQQIEDNVSSSLSDLLSQSKGVNVLKSGSNIGKPVIHGLYGNRLTIINNGVVQSGQQWGIDHSPEIDPSTANNITIIKGASALEYGGNVGGVVLIESEKVGRDPHLHGGINYAYETNGRGHTLNGKVKKYNPQLSWIINGAYRTYGDRSTPDYFLNNTGFRELNGSIQLEKSWKDRAFANVYISTFNAENGILRGSHIGNLTDLKAALSRDQPFYTEESFKREINEPRQDVAHNLIRLNYKKYLEDEASWKITTSFQSNQRKEYDIRRSGRSEMPALSLSQYTFTLDVNYKKPLTDRLQLSIGNQSAYVDNTNNPDTGILPLIPDYAQVKDGAYAIINGEYSHSSFFTAVRYNYTFQNVAVLDRSSIGGILRYKKHYHNFLSSQGYTYRFSHKQSLDINASYAQRNPAINELYSSGLHQGVSGIEEGDSKLNNEIAIKGTIAYRYTKNSILSFESLIYYQRFKNYIFLNPEKEYRLTIRGAFPVFQYTQTAAEIYGIDVGVEYSLLPQHLHGSLRYSYLKGNDLGNDRPLINMPQNRLDAALTFRVNRNITLLHMQLHDTEIKLSNSLVYRQDHIDVNQDFAPPPDGYHLINLELTTNITFPDYKIRLLCKIENMLDNTYRDYLNRHRYFADDLGRSVQVGLNFKF